MANPKLLFLLFALCLASCQAMTDRMAEDIADQVSEQLADEIDAAVALQVGMAGAVASPTAEQTQSPFTCEQKTCSNMSSCQEAVYKLNHCGHGSLDGNNDGVPCQSICNAAAVTAVAYQAPQESQPSPQVPGEIAEVIRVIDGDTIEVLLNGESKRVRYLQVNTPERDEPCFRESTAANADLVSGKTVRLEPDVESVDRYGRLLRYVYVGSIMVERVLVAEGFAEVVLYPPNDAHYEEFLALERAAADAGLGCHPTGIFDDGSTRR